jgi:glycosyl transferase family 25
MHAFLINLDSSPDRLAYMGQQAAGAGFEIERFSALRGSDIRDAGVFGSAFDARLSNGEAGCYASHLCCHQMIIDRELPYGLVLEDDVQLDGDFAAVAQAAAEAAPQGWDYIHLSSNIKRAVQPIKRLDGVERDLIVYSRLPVNMAAYLISAQGAQKFLAPRPRVRPIDMDVRYGWLMDFNIYGVAPPPARQNESFDSDIWRGEGKRKSLPGQAWSPGFVSELRGMAWQAGKLGLGTWLSLAAANAVRPVKRKSR